MNEAPDLSEQPLKIGLAIASLILGISSVGASFVLVGGVFSVLGIFLGFRHLKNQNVLRSMARWGIVTSLIGLLMTLALSCFYYDYYLEYQEMMAGFEEMDFFSEDWIGTPAPELVLKDLEGNVISLKEFQGKRVMIDLWATWCPPCVKEIPHFVKLREEISQDELVILGISDEDEDELKNFLSRHKVNYPMVSEIDLPAPFSEVVSLPTTFFIDRKGVIQEIFEGYHDYDTLKKAALQEDYGGEIKSQPLLTE